MRLKTIIMNNVAPSGNLILDFNNENIAVLSGVNGTGKTTILSYIADSFYELAKKAFFNEFEDKQNKFYRVSSSLYSVKMSESSIIYLRFINGSDTYDYVNITGQCSEEHYLSVACLENTVPFSKLERSLKDNSFIKYWSLNSSKDIREIFNHGLLTYFPSYRYELPHYLNDPYKIELKFKTDTDFVGYLTNPIEVTSGIQQIANWLMDIVLDVRVKNTPATILLKMINAMLSNILLSKLDIPVRIGIGERNQGATRLSVTDNDGKVVYPSIFCMSSGELALLCLFVEIIRQSDRILGHEDKINGIVLVDEIDKHLHIKLQKEILPRLIAMFPNIQFIVSSHSPFLGLGLEENENISYKIFDLDNGGIPCPPSDNEIFRDAYTVLLHERENFSASISQLQKQIRELSRPFVITEGKTDWKHLKATMQKLNITLDISFDEFETTLGDKTLLTMLKYFLRLPNTEKIIGIFDRDNFDELRKCDKDLAVRLESEKYVSLGNNVYAFAVPVAHEDIYGSHTSIEHYYTREDLTKKTPKERRLFLGEEFLSSGFSKDGIYHTRCNNIQHKIEINGVIEEKVYDISQDREEKCSVALSKDDFAQMILSGDDFARDFDFSSFRLIFYVIEEICSQNDPQLQ